MALLNDLLRWAEVEIDKILKGDGPISDADKSSLRKLGFILFESPFDLDKMEKVVKELEEQHVDLHRPS
jgi:hypothetical protein